MILKIKGPDSQDIEVKSMEETSIKIWNLLGQNTNYNQLEGMIINEYRKSLNEFGMNGGRLKDIDLPQDSSLLIAGVIDLAMKSPWNRSERDTILKLCDKSLKYMDGERKDIAGNYVKNAWNELKAFGPNSFSGDTILQLMNFSAKKTQVDANGGTLNWNAGDHLLYQNKPVGKEISPEHLDKIFNILKSNEAPKEVKQFIIRIAYDSDLNKMEDAKRVELEALSEKFMGQEYLETVDVFKLSRKKFAANKTINEILENAIEKGGEESLSALPVIDDVRDRGAENVDFNNKVSSASLKIAECLARKKELHELAKNNISTDNGADFLAAKEERKESLGEKGLYEQRKKQKDLAINFDKLKEQAER